MFIELRLARVQPKACAIDPRMRGKSHTRCAGRSRRTANAQHSRRPIHHYAATAMGRASATITVPGRAAEAETLWYDPKRWSAWVDGFGHVVKLDDDWPEPDARLVWDSK